GEVARIFLVQGALIGVVGTVVGVLGGMLIAYNVGVIVPFIEGLLGIHFLPREIYFISELPSDPQSGDIITIGVTSLVLSLLATLHPSWRASRLQPAQVLRHDCPPAHPGRRYAGAASPQSGEDLRRGAG